MIFAKYLPHLYQGADHKGHRTYNMGGGGGGGPTTSTVTQSNIPEYLRPQVEALLGAGMQEYFNAEYSPGQSARYDTEGNLISPATEGTYDITGTKPYTPYSQNAADYFAPFSQQQQQVFGEAAGMQTPGGFMAGQQMTGMAGQGGLDTVGSAYGYGAQGAGYGGQGSMFGQQAAGTGSMYEQMATDPRSMQAYMSPYMQNVVEIQKQQAIEDAQRAQLGANLNAAKYGTYGGARQTLAQTQREAGLNKQLSDIQAQGLQSAFDQAQKSQQFGVTSGLQGLQAGISGAQTGIQGAGMGLQGVQGAQAGFGLLGRMGEQAANIGTAQQQADIARLGFQRDIAVTPNNNDNKTLSTSRSRTLRLRKKCRPKGCLPLTLYFVAMQLPTSTVSQYQAAANPLQTVGALGTAAGGFGTLMGGGKKAGGAIKLAKGGGITDTDAIESYAEDLSIPQLQQTMENKSLPKYVGMPILENKVNEAERMKMAQAMMGSEQQEQPQSISDALMQRASTVNVAGGGIIAFEAGGLITPRILQEALNKVNAARNPQEKQAAQSAYNQLLKAYQTQTSSASDTGAGIGDVRPEGGIAPSTEPAPVKAAPVEPQSIKMDPEPKPEGITSIVEPTRQEEVEQFLKERAAIMGEDEYAKALKARAEKESSIYDRLSSAGAQIGLAGSMLRDPSKFGTYAQQAADLQGAQRKSAEQRELAALEAQKAERDTKGKAFDVIEGRREKRAEAQFDRQSKVLAANIAARKPTDLKYYAEMRLKASQGDEEAKIIVAGINDYLQQSAIGRNIVAQQGVEVREKAIDVNLYDKAVQIR
jgi:hypothetical protein